MFGFSQHETIALTIVLVDWVIRISAIFFVPRNRKPNSAIAWLMLLFIAPIPGLLAYLLIGNPKLPKSRRDAQKTLDHVIDLTMKSIARHHDSQQLMDTAPPEKYHNQAVMNRSLTHLPVSGGNHADILTEYNDIFDCIIRDIETARHFVHIEYFIICLDNETEELFAALGRAVARGVKVRLLYDSISTLRYPGYRAMLRRLKADGVATVSMLPLRFPGFGYVRPDLRNHRKIVVVDGVIGYTGSQNLIKRNYHRKDDLYYDEVVVRVHGAAALQLAAVFVTDWHAETGELLSTRQLATDALTIQRRGNTLIQIVPSGPGYEDENNLKLFTSLLYRAEKSVTIVNPYFVPDEALSMAIVSAARRGITITMINSESMDQWMVGHAQRSFYEEMLRAGVRIFLYEAPILLHSKFMLVDNDLAVIGSSNMDIRSFLLDLEVTLVAYDKKIVRTLRSVEHRYLSRSKEIHLRKWQQRPPRKVLLDNIARLTSALQ